MPKVLLIKKCMSLPSMQTGVKAAQEELQLCLKTEGAFHQTHTAQVNQMTLALQTAERGTMSMQVGFLLDSNQPGEPERHQRVLDKQTLQLN